MKIALVGNQNSGKTTLFNLLTGMNQKIGNWPGVTIERKSGIIKGTSHELIDLPGIYSFSPYTSEEEVSRKFVFEENPDLIINIVDATSLERSLYLTTQLLELDTKVIIALNMTDMLEKKGISLDVDLLSKELGVEIVQISALKKLGIEKLIDTVDTLDIKVKNKKQIFNIEIEKVIDSIKDQISVKHSRFIAIKAIEKDVITSKYIGNEFDYDIKKLEDKFETDGEEFIASGRYDYIVNLTQKASNKKIKKENVTDKLDKVFLNKWLAIPIFIVIIALIYVLAVGIVGSSTVDMVGDLVDKLSKGVNNLLVNLKASEWIISLICDGIIAGVGAVLGFVPQLIILFICLSLLETTGYMSRIAFMLDKAFKKVGLSGKSIIPFIVGSGCSVPGIMASRAVEDDDERKMTIMLTPFVPCSAKLPIIALFAGAFFPNSKGLIAALLYIVAIVIIFISAFIMKKFIYKKQSTAFISELPEYKLPSVRYVGRDVFDKTIEFIKRAGTIILLCSIVIWFLLSFSFKFEYGVDVEDSILASIGKAISWFFYPILGQMNWRASVSAIQGLVAKEQVVSSLEIIAGFAEGVSETDPTAIFNAAYNFTKFGAFAFMLFNLFSAPCFGAIGAMKRELGSKKRMFIAVLFQTGLAYVLASIIGIIGILVS